MRSAAAVFRARGLFSRARGMASAPAASVQAASAGAGSGAEYSRKKQRRAVEAAASHAFTQRTSALKSALAAVSAGAAPHPLVVGAGSASDVLAAVERKGEALDAPAAVGALHAFARFSSHASSPRQANAAADDPRALSLYSRVAAASAHLAPPALAICAVAASKLHRFSRFSAAAALEGAAGAASGGGSVVAGAPVRVEALDSLISACSAAMAAHVLAAARVPADAPPKAARGTLGADAAQVLYAAAMAGVPAPALFDALATSLNAVSGVLFRCRRAA